MVSCSLLASPMMMFGGTCLQLRRLSTMAGLGCYASALPALWCWQHSWWLGSIAILAALWLAGTVGGGKWDRHFVVPTPRVHALLVALVALSLAVAGAFVAMGIGPPALRLSSVMALADAATPTVPFWSCTGAGVHTVPGSVRLPASRNFIARPVVRWHGVEGVGAVRMSVSFSDGRRTYTERTFVDEAIGAGSMAVASAGWQEIRLPFEAGSADATVTGIAVEVVLPGAGSVQVRVPVPIEESVGAGLLPELGPDPLRIVPAQRGSAGPAQPAEPGR